MKELKFRAYHKYMEKMLIPIKLHLNDWKITCFETLLDDNVYQVKIDDKEYWLHIMQYTWIKDKNWKEIYGGDLIQYDWNSRIWEVYFDEDRLQYRIRCKGKARPDDKDTMEISYSLEWLELTVVGNIYEDKHLLNN